MHESDIDTIKCPSSKANILALEPVHNILTSLFLLTKAHKLSGLNEWVTHTADALTPEQRFNNRIVMDGLYFAVFPDRSFPNFTSYINYLEALNPELIRDRVLQTYAASRRDDAGCTFSVAADPEKPFDFRPVLEDVDTYLRFMLEHFPAGKLDLEIESEAYRYLKDPASLKPFMINHLKTMWQEVVASEWERNLPILQMCLEAFRNMQLDRLCKIEAAQLIYGHELDDQWKARLEEAEHLIFVPSPHLGPYLRKFKYGTTLWVFFGARIPEGVKADAPDLSRTEILTRLNALTDDTRLRILKLLLEEGEQRSTEIIARLGLSQSAASRHLQQLSATGYLNERRCDCSAKSYVPNVKRIEDTLRAVSLFLFDKPLK